MTTLEGEYYADSDQATMAVSTMSPPSKLTEGARASSNNEHSTTLSISAEDSVISLVNLREKATQLLTTENAVTLAPGDDKKARMVLLFSSIFPHLVQSRFGAQYVCDNNRKENC